MNVLLDTHIAIWAAVSPEDLPERARRLISEEAGTAWVSAASIWEIAIKRATGRKDVPPLSAAQAIEEFTAMGLRMLDVTPMHAAAVESLPRIHGDPFDRLLVAQALSEPLRLITHDKTVAAYSDMVLLV